MSNMKPMPWLLRTMLRTQIRGITLPPFGMYLRPGWETDLQLQAHEAVHWAQYERMGIFQFYVQYVWYSLTRSYQKNPMEIEAREKSGVG